MKANLISKEKLSKLLEHDDETKDKHDEELYLVKSLKKYVNDIFLVSENVFMDIQEIYYSNDLEGLQDDTEFRSTIDYIFIYKGTND